MLKIYLFANAAIYFLLAAWCTIAPQQTAAAIGLSPAGPSGRSEYLTLYGGLQLGLALLFLVTALRPDWHFAGLLAALCLYVPIALFRLTSLLTISGIERTTWIVGGLEIVLAIGAAALWLSRGGK